MGSPREFANTMRKFAAFIPNRMQEIKREVAREVLKAIIPATPVRDGIARGNYHVSLGAADTSTVLNVKDPTGSGALARGLGTIDGSTRGQSIHINNNTPYIEELNRGSSTQAPAGFMQTAAMQGRLRAAASTIGFKR
jgi:hypothetical protein